MENLSVDLMLKALFVLSAITSVTTQGVKNVLDDMGTKYSSNLIAIIVSAICCVFVVTAYCIINGIACSATVIVFTIALIWISFLLATIGYDKVKMLIEQIMRK